MRARIVVGPDSFFALVEGLRSSEKSSRQRELG